MYKCVIDPLKSVIVDRKALLSSGEYVTAYVLMDGWHEAIIVKLDGAIYAVGKNKKKMYLSKRVIEDGTLKQIFYEEIYTKYYHTRKFTDWKRAIWGSRDYSPEAVRAIKDLITFVEAHNSIPNGNK